MFRTYASQWNAVDVVGCDGLLHRGLVVNKSEAGLSIDFGIKNKEPALVFYEEVFQDPKKLLKGELLEQDVELLYQLSPDQPWKWFPAQLLSASTDYFFLVDMQTEGVHVRAVFRKDRVRRHSLHRVKIGQNDIIKEDVPVPSGFVATKDFYDRWKEEFWKTHPVGLEGGRFSYIHSRNDKEIKLEFFIPPVNMTDTELCVLPRGTKKLHRGLLVDERMETMENNSWIRQLPLEILAEVFNHMEISKKTQLRRVCVRFASAVSSRVCNVDIVHPSLASMDGFTFASAMYTTLSRRTTHVIITKDNDHSVDSDIRVLQQLVKATGTSIPHLTLVDVAIHVKYLVNNVQLGLSRTFPSSHSMYNRLVLRNVTVREAVGTHRIRGRHYFEDVHIGERTVNTDRESDFRQILEANCETPKAKNLSRLGEWIKQLNTNSESHRYRQEMVIEALQQWQYGESRFGPHCTWRDVELASLATNLDALRKTTLYALMSIQDNFRLSRRRHLSLASSTTDGSDDSATDAD